MASREVLQMGWHMLPLVLSRPSLCLTRACTDLHCAVLYHAHPSTHPPTLPCHLSPHYPHTPLID
jgi:hypothetical protein